MVGDPVGQLLQATGHTPVTCGQKSLRLLLVIEPQGLSGSARPLQVAAVMGAAVGAADGDGDGAIVGSVVGKCVGSAVGGAVGTDVAGLEVGSDDGDPLVAMALRCWRLALQFWSRTKRPLQ